jgi:hypothetical protein
MIFSHHLWFLDHAEEEDGPLHSRHSVMPRHLRQKWLPKMRHPKIKYLFTSQQRQEDSGGEGGRVLKAFLKKPSPSPTATSMSSRVQEGSDSVEKINADASDEILLSNEVKETSLADLTKSPTEGDWKELPPGVSAEASETDTDDDEGDKEDDRVRNLLFRS